jgi:BRCA1-like protein
MAKVAVKLEHEPGLSKAQADRLPPGQAHWWLRGDDFIRLPKRVRGDDKLDQVVHLEPGTYTLGVGPAQSGVREQIVVEEQAAPASIEEKPKKKKHAFAKGSLPNSGGSTGERAGGRAGELAVKGKSIVITGDLDAMERDAAKAWLEGLGAKVSTSVSSKTDYLLVGRDPGPKKLEKAAELGTRVISEGELRASLGMAEVAPVAPKAVDKKDLFQAFVAKCDMKNLDRAAIDKLVGPAHFADLGLHEHELWGIAIGPRGGRYSVWIDLKDRPKYAMQCNCREWRPCKHAWALILTAQKHFVPPAPPPEGHEDDARYRPGWE